MRCNGYQLYSPQLHFFSRGHKNLMWKVLSFLVAVIMKFMGDLPLSKHQKETDLVFSLLKVCDPASVDFLFLSADQLNTFDVQ